MSDKWYYVKSGERVGPVEVEVIHELLATKQLIDEDFVWKKGFVNGWTAIKDVDELEIPDDPATEPEEIPQMALPPQIEEESNLLGEIAGDEKSLFIKIGVDRGANEVEYGPYDLELVRRLFKENRINAKTFVFAKGMSHWRILADFEDFAEIFEDLPPPIEDEERRNNWRKPFIARMYIENNQKVFVGICRDISVGGMQVLVDDFPGQVGEKISINVHPENTEFHFVASGKIVRVLEGHQGFSFRFHELSSDSEAAIKNYLENA